MGKLKSKISLIITIALFILSISLLIFPTISNFIYQYNNHKILLKYNNSVDSMSEEEKKNYLSEAELYNESLTEVVTNDVFDSSNYNSLHSNYENILNFGDGQICSIEIPKIDVNLPVYHGVTESVLKKGAAHSANTSFPIGGKNTHAVISAHTAYPGKVFFDNLTELEEGDLFYINIIDKKLSYKVCDISIVKPNDTSKLQIVYDKDLITLVTCYPYSVNSHRLLVTGERVYEDSYNTPDSINKGNISNNYICVTVVIFIVIAIFLILFFKHKHKRKSWI